MNRVLRGATVAAGLVILAACGGAEEEPAVVADTEVTAEPAAPAGQMEGMQGMGGMEGMQQGGAASQLEAHMKMMEGAGGEQIKAMLPEHRQLVANTIAQYNQEMRGMNMADDEEWNSTVNALRQDLVRLPEMSADELKAFLPEHQERINKLQEMHRSMMASM